jgi:hypothetical protein
LGFFIAMRKAVILLLMGATVAVVCGAVASLLGLPMAIGVLAGAGVITLYANLPQQ